MRLCGLALLALVVVGVKQIVRIDGTASGSGQFRFAWKWSPRRGENIGQIAPKARPAGAPVVAAGFDSPGYLGSDHIGVIRNLELEPDWSTHKPVELWRKPIGLGWSSFAVAGAQAITLEQRGEKEMTVSYDLTTGEVVWTHANTVRFSEGMGGDGPRSTPTIADGRVYVMGATGLLDCLDLATGKLIWSRDTLKDYSAPNLMWGKSCSPLLVDDLVVITGGFAPTNPCLLAYKQPDGVQAWHAGAEKASYVTPMLVTLAGKRQILSVNAATVTGHDPADGHILWKYTWLNDNFPKCAQPLVLDGDRVFLSGDYGFGCVMLQIAAGEGSDLAVKQVWAGRSLRCQLSNMIAKDGCIYGLDDGALACIDAASGARKWRDDRDAHQRYGHGQLLEVGNLLLVQSEKGSIALVDAADGLHELTTLPALSSKTWNVPTVAGEYLLARNDVSAVCYRLPVRGK